jgi:hypothetical protein
MAGTGQLILPEVSVPTTPGSGKEAVYMSSDTPARMKRVDSAGTVWIQQEFVLISNTADYTLTDGNSAQQVFNGSTNGTITVPASQSWQFDALYLLTNTGTTSHTWATLFGGTASLTSIAYWAEAYTATSNALTAVSGIYATAATALVVTAAQTSATENVAIRLHGLVRINAAGTLIPQIQASAKPNGTEKILKNSYFRMSPFGADTTAYMGNWS